MSNHHFCFYLDSLGKCRVTERQAGKISKGAVIICLGYISGYSPLMLADRVRPGVELGTGRKNIVEKLIPSKSLMRMKMKKQ